MAKASNYSVQDCGRDEFSLKQVQKYFILAGEASGDLFGSMLIRALRKREASCKISAVAGPMMRKEGIETLFFQEKLEQFGFWELPKSIFLLYRLLNKVVRHLLEHRVDRVYLIDYSNFNLKLAEKLKRKGYRASLIKLVSPQVWAWGKKRIPRIESAFDELVCFYPFEPSYYDPNKITALFFGHPIVEMIRDLPKVEGQPYPFGSYLLFLPGSRKKEVKRHLPIMLTIAERLSLSFPKLTMVFLLDQKEENALPLKVQKQLKRFHVFERKERYSLMQKAFFAVTKSGTVTLELALLGVPAFVIYKVPLVDYLIARYILRIKLKYFCMVNILLEKEVYPEYVGYQLKLEKMIEHLREQLTQEQDERVDLASALQKKLKSNKDSFWLELVDHHAQ